MSETDTGRAMWTDEPFDIHSADAFGRDSFVATVIKRIQKASASDASTVFGLVGPWGSGKTSILDRVRDGLGDDWEIADFTPWSSGDGASMSLEFVSTVADLLGEKAAGDTRAKLAGYAGFIAPLLGAIPFVGDGVKGTAEHALEAIASRPPWHKQFAELSEMIQSLDKRVLIVVDDVDRLGGSELLTLLRVIRLLGRFRGVHYLIAYDQDTVEDLLRSTGSVGRSAAFMEKIVQYPFETPPIPRSAVIRLLNELLEELMEVTGTRFDQADLQRATALVDALAPQIRTPRSLGRFREHLGSFADHVGSAKLDLLDYVSVTWLRLNAHGAWSALQSWHRELISGERITTFTETEPLGPDYWESVIQSAHPQSDSAGTLEVLSFLFQGVQVRGRSSYAHHPRAMNDSTYFGRYLLLDIPEDDIDDELVDVVAGEGDDAAFNAKAHQLAAVIDGDDDALANLALARLTAIRNESNDPNARLLLFIADRIGVRSDEVERVGSPLNALRTLVSREVGLAILAEEMDARAIVTMLGEKESLHAVWAAARVFRSRRPEILNRFSRYWLERVRSDVSGYLVDGRLGAIAEIILFGIPSEETDGLLDPQVADFDAYVRTAKAFFYLAEWVGSTYTYELRFRSDAFRALVSASVREQHRANVAQRAGKMEYDLEDHPSREVSDEVITAFVLDSLSSLLD